MAGLPKVIYIALFALGVFGRAIVGLLAAAEEHLFVVVPRRTKVPVQVRSPAGLEAGGDPVLNRVDPVVVVAGVQLHGQPKLLEVIETTDLLRHALGPASAGKKQRGEDGDNRNDYQQLDQGKPPRLVGRACVSFPIVRLAKRAGLIADETMIRFGLISNLLCRGFPVGAGYVLPIRLGQAGGFLHRTPAAPSQLIVTTPPSPRCCRCPVRSGSSPRCWHRPKLSTAQYQLHVPFMAKRIRTLA